MPLNITTDDEYSLFENSLILNKLCRKGSKTEDEIVNETTEVREIEIAGEEIPVKANPFKILLKEAVFDFKNKLQNWFYFIIFQV